MGVYTKHEDYSFPPMMLVPAVVSAPQNPTTGYAPVNGLKMYYEVHGSGEPVVLLHGAFMTISLVTREEGGPLQLGKRQLLR